MRRSLRNRQSHRSEKRKEKKVFEREFNGSQRWKLSLAKLVKRKSSCYALVKQTDYKVL
jgi:hypothetical protein